MAYAQFSVDLNSFALENLHDDMGRGYRAFKHFLEFWREFGVFVMLKDCDVVPITARLPDDLRKEFSELQKTMKTTVRRWDFPDVAFRDLLNDIVDGTCANLDRLLLDVIGLHPEVYPLVPGAAGLHFRLHGREEEVCRIDDLLITDTVRELRRLRAMDVGKHDEPDHVWRTKLLPLFRASELVGIVDPYAVIEFASAKAPIESGLGKLMERAAREKGQIGEIEVLTSFKGRWGQDGKDLRRATLVKLEEFGRALNLTDFSVSVAAREDYLHDRFIYGAGHSIDLGIGLNILKMPPRKQAHNYSFKELTPERNLLYLEQRKGHFAHKIRF